MRIKLQLLEIRRISAVYFLRLRLDRIWRMTFASEKLTAAVWLHAKCQEGRVHGNESPNRRFMNVDELLRKVTSFKYSGSYGLR